MKWGFWLFGAPKLEGLEVFPVILDRRQLSPVMRAGQFLGKADMPRGSPDREDLALQVGSPLGNSEREKVRIMFSQPVVRL